MLSSEVLCSFNVDCLCGGVIAVLIDSLDNRSLLLQVRSFWLKMRVYAFFVFFFLFFKCAYNTVFVLSCMGGVTIESPNVGLYVWGF